MTVMGQLAVQRRSLLCKISGLILSAWVPSTGNMTMPDYCAFLFILLLSPSAFAQTPPPDHDPRMAAIIEAVSPSRIEQDIRTLVGFGTRHTLSETASPSRGIGAARRWIRASFEAVSKACGQCLEITMQSTPMQAGAGERIVKDTEIVNVIAIQRGTTFPNRYVIMSGDIDSRISDVNNYTDDAPGANDNASGMAGVIEAARVLSRYRFPASILYVGLSGEEQGLYGGRFLADMAKEQGWQIIGVLNNDMIGNWPATSMPRPGATCHNSNRYSSTGWTASAVAATTARLTTPASRRCASWRPTSTTTASMKTCAPRTASVTVM